MRIISLLLLLVVLHVSSFGQKITYNIPEGYEAEIGKGDYKSLVDLAVPIVAKRYTIAFVKDGAIQLKEGQEMETVNLHNLISRCIAVKDRSQWSKVVQEHFDNLFSSIDEQKKIDPTNYETVKNYLGLRIYPKEIVEQRGGAAPFVVRTDLDGTYTMLMLDLPGAFTPVQKQVFELWKLDAGAVFAAAQGNINKQSIRKFTQSFDVDSAKIEMSFLTNEDYGASYALDLMSNSPELVGEWGSVVATPNKGLVVLCEVSKNKPLDFVKFIQQVTPLVEKSYRGNDQPISNQFFWYYKGKFTRIEVLTTAEGNINVISPSGLTALMTQQ